MATSRTFIDLFLLVSLACGLGSLSAEDLQTTGRSFTIDYENNTFLMDGVPFRYVSGSFHYFRALPETWRTRLRTMRAAGLNAVSTYVSWALHNPKDGIYNFDGMADLEKFINLAQEEGLYVILRPGPYICAEIENGGLPYWLLSKNPDMKARTNDESYTKEVSIWFSQLMPRIQKYLYGNGGPIIMVQVENEYALFSACDKDYMNWLRDEFRKYIKDEAVLFTTDPPSSRLFCSKVDGVYATVDFGATNDINGQWKGQRSVEPKGPLVNSEFYPGWLTHWGEENQRRNADDIVDSFKGIMQTGANVNFYMFFGGTNFGFSAGANAQGSGNYAAHITSYDYDAPMDEAGDPTPKYMKIREAVGQFLELPSIPVPEKAPKMSLPDIQLKPIDLLLSDSGRRNLVTKTVTSDHPQSFEQLDQFSGLVIYEAELPVFQIDPVLLTVNGLADRAIVLVNQTFIGVLSRQNNINSLPINDGFGKTLQIIVENQGRINFAIANDQKGILGSVVVQEADDSKYEIKGWESSSVPLESEQIMKLVEERKDEVVEVNKRGLLLEGPAIYYGEFVISDGDEIYDTYLDPTGWGKGVVFVNGFNLGRYWPNVGPQITLYVPKELLQKGTNKITIVEYQNAPSNGRIRFTSTPQLDGGNSYVTLE